ATGGEDWNAGQRVDAAARRGAAGARASLDSTSVEDTLTRAPSVKQVARFRSLIRDRFGLDYAANRVDFLAEVLGQRLTATGVDAEAYLQALAEERSPELGELAQQLTVNETFFFRNQSHFQALTELVIPDIIARCRSTRQLNLLSAGCASGE